MTILTKKYLDRTTPLISVVVAVFNREKTIRQCIESVVNQNFDSFELLVVDGGSSDSTVEILNEFSSQIDWQISEADSGIYEAWNKAVNHSKGEWICFLGSDDYLHDENVLLKISQRLEELPSTVDFAYSKVMMVSDDGNELFITGEEWELSRKKLKRGMSVPHPAMMHKRRLFQSSNSFDESFKIAGDYDLFLQNQSKENVVFIQNVISVCMRQGGISSQYKNYKISLLERRKAQKKAGMILPDPLWLVDMFNAAIISSSSKLFGPEFTKKLIDAIRGIFRMPKYWTKI